MLNIFRHLRELKVDLTDETLFEFEAAKHFTDVFCYNSSITGGPASVIADGNESTAWTTQAIHDPNVQNVTIDFKTRRVAIRNYTLETLCNPPIDLLIEGSNDKSYWSTLSKVSKPHESNALNTFYVKNRKSFRYIRISQTDSTAYDKRLIIYNFEIYGTFGNLLVQTPQTMIRLPSSLLCCYFFFYLT